MARPAVPAKLRFKMRFVRADGSPFANTAYRVRWGPDSSPPTPVAQTNSDGWAEEMLDGHYVRGVVELGEEDSAKKFTPRLCIDVVLVKPPGPAPKHKRKDAEDDPPDPPPPASPPKGGGGRGEPPPSDPGRTAPSPAPPPATPPPGLISMPPERRAPDFKPEGRGQPAKLEPVGEAPVDVERRLERLDRQSKSYHEKRARVFSLAWRLHNLGFLSIWSGQLSFPLDGGKYEDILDALNRYAYKHGLPLVSDGDLVSPDDSLSQIWDHVEQMHDDL